MTLICLNSGDEERCFNTIASTERASALAFIRAGGDSVQLSLNDESPAEQQQATFDSLKWDLDNTQSLFLPEQEPSELQNLRGDLGLPNPVDASNASADAGEYEIEANAQTGGELEWGPFAVVGEGILLEEGEEIGIPEDLRAKYNLKSTESGRFFIEYKDRRNGQGKRWNFTLLPAIDNNLGINISSPISRGSGAKVPEAKPGLMVQTVMKHKNLVIPGSTPIIQTIGPEMRVVQLVGAFIGNESAVDLENDRAVTTNRDADGGFSTGESALYSRRGESLENNLDSYEMARLFDKEVVIQGAPVILSVLSRNTNDFENGAFTNFTYEVVITGIKIYAARSDRTYYTINALVTDYEVARDFAGALEIDRQEAKKIAEDIAKQQEEESAAAAEEEAAAAEDGEETQGTTEPSSDVESLEEASSDEDGHNHAEATNQTNIGSLEEPSMAGTEASSQYEHRHGDEDE